MDDHNHNTNPNKPDAHPTGKGSNSCHTVAPSINDELVPFSQCNNEMIELLDECEAKAEREYTKKRKVTPTKLVLPKCSSCNMTEYHEIKFGGYCLSKVLAYCNQKENVRSLDWVTVSFMYKEAYKEIWRVCTYLDTDFYDPTDSTLDLPDCMATSSYLEAKDLMQCKIVLNRASIHFWDGAMRKVDDEFNCSTINDNTGDK